MLFAFTNLVMDQPTAQSIDVEKSAQASVVSPTSKSTEIDPLSSECFVVSSAPVFRRTVQWNTRIQNLAGLEARGITRVPPEERQQASVLGYAQMAAIWFSPGITVYISIWGAQNGNRTTVCCGFFVQILPSSGAARFDLR